MYPVVVYMIYAYFEGIVPAYYSEYNDAADLIIKHELPFDHDFNQCTAGYFSWFSWISVIVNRISQRTLQ